MDSSKKSQTGEVKKTCRNCAHYSDTLYSDDGSFNHIHDYCWVWQRCIPSDVMFDRLDCKSGFDDIECGIAECWAFEPRTDINAVQCFPDINKNPKYSEDEDDN